MTEHIGRCAAFAAIFFAGSLPCWAQAGPALSVCSGAQKAAACAAVRGDRADGWAAQSRAEVMAPHAIVTTSQPLAAEAGLQVMRNGGNAIDAAVATAAMLNLVEPSSTGVAADMFAVIYIAKENKVYTLNASGKAPSGPTVAHLSSATATTRETGARAPACRGTAS
jgi:gamma-glutamyltranspeptidase/glutathione hydrolase